jgi:hypothetical protein
MTKVTIKKNDYDEYELPTEVGTEAIYYTDDKDDAIGTAKLILGDDVEITFRRGTYNADEEGS